MINMEQVQKILICNHHGIGDVIMTLPLMIGLNKYFPHKELNILFKSKVERDTISDTIQINKSYFLTSAKTKAEKINLLLDLKKQKYDLVIAPFTKKASGEIVFRFISQKYLLGETNKIFTLFNVKVKERKEHKVFKSFRILKLLKPDAEFLFPKLKYSKQSYNNIEKYIYNINCLKIGIHPGSGEIEKHKRWNIKNYVKLINLLKESGKKFKIFIFGGPGEGHLANSIIKSLQEIDIINVTEKLSIKETIALIDQMDIFIGADSGLMHIAANLRKKVFSVFGPTDPIITSPFGENVHIISNNVNCKPCYPKLIAGCNNPKCMNIDAIKVFNTIKQCGILTE